MNYRTLSLAVSFALVLSSACGVLRGQDEPSELAQARTVYERDVEFANKPIRDRYLSRLDALKRALGSRGDARGAVAVQEEIDRVQGIGAGIERFAGVWSLKYANGTVRIYSITADGILTFIEDNGVRVPPRAVKIVRKGSDFMVESVAGTIERLSLAGNKLMIEHFNPKTTYPTGAPSVRATGTRIAGEKP